MFRKGTFIGGVALALVLLGPVGLRAQGQADPNFTQLKQQVDQRVAYNQRLGAQQVQVKYWISSWDKDDPDYGGQLVTATTDFNEAVRIANEMLARGARKVQIDPDYNITWPPGKQPPEPPPLPPSPGTPGGVPSGYDETFGTAHPGAARSSNEPEDTAAGAGPGAASRSDPARAKTSFAYADQGRLPLGSQEVVSFRKQPSSPRPIAPSDQAIVVSKVVNGKEVYVGTYSSPAAAKRAREAIEKAGDRSFVNPMSRSDAGIYVAQKFRQIEWVRPDWVDVQVGLSQQNQPPTPPNRAEPLPGRSTSGIPAQLVGDWVDDERGARYLQVTSNGTAIYYGYAEVSGPLSISGNRIRFSTDEGFNGNSGVDFDGTWTDGTMKGTVTDHYGASSFSLRLRKR